jgi:hypothetical protein
MMVNRPEDLIRKIEEEKRGYVDTGWIKLV